jgi:hypothetical protein
MLYNFAHGSGALRIGKYKLITGSNATWDPRPLPPATSSSNGSTGSPNGSTAGETEGERSRWHYDPGAGDIFVTDAAPNNNIKFLFDLDADPNEHIDLYNDKSMATVVKQLEDRLAVYAAQAVPALYDTTKDDPNSNPALHNGTWAVSGCKAT